MNYRIIYTRLVNVLRINMIKDMGKSFKSNDDRIIYLRKNCKYIEDLKSELISDNTIWTKEMFNGKINNLEDAICNNNKDDDYRINKYIDIINGYKFRLLDNGV